jgi:hypothetical protein
MNVILVVSLLVAFGCAWYVGRRISRKRALRRRKARRERNEKAGLRSFTPVKTKRSQMHADDDPTTVMERITESKPRAEDSHRKA